MKVVVIGAGIAGLAIGWRLRQAGADVTVLERAQPAHGATWAAAGMLSVVGEGAQDNPAERTLAQSASSLWPAFAGELEEACGRSVGYRADGKLILALDGEEHAHLQSIAANFPGSAVIPADDARAMEPTIAAATVGALWDPTEAQVDNRAVGTALVRAFLMAGGDLQSNEAVVSIEVQGQRVVGVRSPFAVYEGDAYVVAAGAWTSTIAGLPSQALPVVIPVKGEMIALACDHIPGRILWGGGVYLVPRHNRLLVGATATRDGFDTALTQAAMQWLFGAAQKLVPALSRESVVEHWSGLRPGSSDNLPILGRTGIEGLYIASGQFRNGILFAPAIADSVSALVLGRASTIDIGAFDPLRFR